MCPCVHHGWHGTHRFDIQVLATHKRQHGCIDILHCCNDPWLQVSGVTWEEYFARNARCTVITDLLRDIPTHKTSSVPAGAAIFSLHTHASPSGRKVNDEKQHTGGKKFLSCFFYLYRFGKYVSYGFPIINFCNPAVQHGTPCMCLTALHTATRTVIIFPSHTARQYSRFWGDWPQKSKPNSSRMYQTVRRTD
jgi:hypothetical protein